MRNTNRLFTLAFVGAVSSTLLGCSAHDGEPAAIATTTSPQVVTTASRAATSAAVVPASTMAPYTTPAAPSLFVPNTDDRRLLIALGADPDAEDPATMYEIVDAARWTCAALALSQSDDEWYATKERVVGIYVAEGMSQHDAWLFVDTITSVYDCAATPIG